MVDSLHDLVPGADLEGRLGSLLADMSLTRPVFMTSLIPLIGSSSAIPLFQRAIVDDLHVYAATNSQVAFVTLHGTDTMVRTNAALSYALMDLSASAVVIGFQFLLRELGTDAAASVVGVFRTAAPGRLSGVVLSFGHRPLAGNRATRSSSWVFTGFGSSDVAPPATIDASRQWVPGARNEAGWKDAAPYTRHNIVVVDLAPGITAARLEAPLTSLLGAAILRAFGIDNIPSQKPGLTDVVERMIDAGTAVIVTSQCHESKILLGYYETGDTLVRNGTVGSRDMALEVAYAKVQLLLSQGLTGNGLTSWMGRFIVGELSP